MGYGKELKRILDEKGITIHRLAKKTEIPATTLYSVVKRNSSVRYDYALRIADVLGISPNLICAHVPDGDSQEGQDRINSILAGISEAGKRECILRNLKVLMTYDSEKLETVERLLLWFGRRNVVDWDYLEDLLDVFIRHCPVKRGREEKMDWREELKKQAGVPEEKDIVDLNDVEGREILEEQHLAFMAQTSSENADVIAADSDV